MHVRRDVGDPVTPLNAEPLEGSRPAITAVEELRVGEPEIPVDDRLALGVQAAGASHELERRERRLHRIVLPADGPALMLGSVDRRSSREQGWRRN